VPRLREDTRLSPDTKHRRVTAPALTDLPEAKSKSHMEWEEEEDSLTMLPTHAMTTKSVFDDVSITAVSPRGMTQPTIPGLGKSATISAPSSRNTSIVSENALFTPPPHMSSLPSPKASTSRVTLQDRRADVSPVMTELLAGQLRRGLPLKHRWSKSWKLVYALGQHGISFTTMLDKVKGKGACIIAMKDTDGRVFGAYSSHPFSLHTGYYGSGECFLWRLVGTHQRPPPPSSHDNFSMDVRIYPWTGKNNYCVLTELEVGLAMGGGDDGRFGLWVDHELDRGYSARSQTFDNDVLTGTPDVDQVDFFVDQLEVWIFVTS